MKETLIEALNQSEIVQQTADALQEPVRDMFAQLGPGRDFLHGKWLGHALHPVLTDIPVGAWTAALVLDAAQMATDDEGLGAASDIVIAVGLAGAVGAAVTGLADWSESGESQAKNVGIVHGLLNVVAAGLYTASLIERRTGSRGKGVVLSTIGYAIAGASAYLGGHLVFGEQMGVDHTATPDRGQPEEFTRVMRDLELREGTPTRVDVQDAAILLVRVDGQIRALSNTCTHLGGPLNEGELEGDSIRCPWHGSRFCLTDGEVLDGPATYPERQFDVRVRDGYIEVRSRD